MGFFGKKREADAPIYFDGLRMPTVFREVYLGGSEEEKRKAVLENNGRLAIIEDFHYEDFHPAGMLRYDGKDGECYLLYTGTGEKRLHFHDLEGLSVASGMLKGIDNDAIAARKEEEARMEEVLPEDFRLVI